MMIRRRDFVPAGARRELGELPEEFPLVAIVRAPDGKTSFDYYERHTGRTAREEAWRFEVTDPAIPPHWTTETDDRGCIVTTFPLAHRDDFWPAYYGDWSQTPPRQPPLSQEAAHRIVWDEMGRILRARARLRAGERPVILERPVEIIDEHGAVPLPARSIRFRQDLFSEFWRTDAVVAVRYAPRGRVYARSLYVHMLPDGIVRQPVGSVVGAYFRNRPIGFVGWAHRPELGFAGSAVPTADRSNWDLDYVSGDRRLRLGRGI